MKVLTMLNENSSGGVTLYVEVSDEFKFKTQEAAEAALPGVLRQMKDKVKA